MAKITTGKVLIKKFFLYFLLFYMFNEESNIFQNKIKYTNFKINDYANNVISGKRKIENKENEVIVIATGKKGEEIKILDTLFKYPPSKVFINESKENLGQVMKVNLTQDGENEITIIWDNPIQDCECMFCECECLISIDMSKFDSSLITSMEGMFFGCSNVSSIDLTNFNTSSVIHMNSCFENCYKLQNINVSIFDTISNQDLSRMFYDCSSLTSLDVSNFDTSLVTMMDGMFYNCHSLTSLDVSNLILLQLDHFMECLIIVIL